MRKIICLSALVLLLCTDTALAESKFEADLFFGSYQPSFSRVNERFYGLNLSGSKIQGFTLGYQILPDCSIRVQIGFSECRSHSPHPDIDIRLKTTMISVLGLFDLLSNQHYKLYTGIGLVDYRVNSNEPILGEPPSSKHNLGFPWNTTILLGVAAPPNKPYQVKGEIQYVAGADGELIRIPLDWDGFKLLISLGVRF